MECGFLICGLAVAALVGGVIGSFRGITGLGVWLGFILGPLGWLLVFVSGDARPRCAECRGAIFPYARRCKNCGCVLDSSKIIKGETPVLAWIVAVVAPVGMAVFASAVAYYIFGVGRSQRVEFDRQPIPEINFANDQNDDIGGRPIPRVEQVKDDFKPNRPPAENEKDDQEAQREARREAAAKASEQERIEREREQAREAAEQKAKEAAARAAKEEAERPAREAAARKAAQEEEDRKEAERAANQEKDAVALLEFARQFIGANDRVRATRQLTEIINKFPKTKAAVEAKKLLKNL